MSHCSKTHPDRSVNVRDDLATFNAIVPLREGGGIVPVGFVKPEGGAITDLAELREYISRRDGILVPAGLTGGGGVGRRFPSAGQSRRGLQLARKRTSQVILASPPSRPAKVMRMEHDQPLDLSVRLHPLAYYLSLYLYEYNYDQVSSEGNIHLRFSRHSHLGVTQNFQKGHLKTFS